MSEGSNMPSPPTWRDIMQVDAPSRNDPYTEFTTEHLFARVWARPGLRRRDRRLITLTVAAVTAQRDSLTAHMRAALTSGDLTADELHEWVVHLAHYGGWPAGTTAHTSLPRLFPSTRRNRSASRLPCLLAWIVRLAHAPLSHLDRGDDTDRAARAAAAPSCAGDALADCA